MDTISYRLIENGSKEREAVLRIQEQCRKFFFVPYVQLDRAIADGLILGAFEGDSTVVGYAWSMVRDGFVRIRYLAVDPTKAELGIGRGIVQELKRRHGSAYGIKLSCRTDYPGWNFWKKMGFKVVRNRPGQAKAGSTLTDFYFELNSNSLFGSNESERRTKIALDANVYFDLIHSDRPHHSESVGLRADWLSAEVELCVTKAIHEDIGRAGDERHEADLIEWKIVESSPQSFNCIHEQVCDVVGKGETAQDKSDRNHLSHAIAENLAAFITRDGFILEHANTIYDKFGISVQRPADFVLSVDTVLNQDRYDRSDVESVGIGAGRVSDDKTITALQPFRRGDERESVLRANMRTWMANPTEWEVRTVTSRHGVEAIFVISRRGPVTEVPFYRCGNSITGQRRGRTLMRYVASTLSDGLTGATLISVTDAHGVTEHSQSLTEVGFAPANGAYHKVHLPGAWKPAEAAAQVQLLEGLPNELKSEFQREFRNLESPEAVLELECRIFPGKLRSNIEVPCLVVPIRPNWARALFDADLGQRGLWDEDADLLFNPTSVYYTGARPAAKQARLLWYISENENYGGTQRIRACSQLRQTVVDEPLALYRQFRHYGVYSLCDVKRAATEKRPKVMAMEFSNTEAFPSPVTLEVVRQIQKNDKQAFQWPTSISESEFFAIYERGFSDASPLHTT